MQSYLFLLNFVYKIFYFTTYSYLVNDEGLPEFIIISDIISSNIFPVVSTLMSLMFIFA